jgi:ubiquinone/menaquinone biosynthesis C-methylase UbiE
MEIRVNFPVAANDVPLADTLVDISNRSTSQGVAVPAYLSEVYTWAYLAPTNVELLDRSIVVDVLLFGNARRLMRAALKEIKPGQKVLMAAHVYGDFVNRLAERVGPQGELDVIDVAPIQVEHCQRKVGHLAHVNIRHADAAVPGGGPYDVVVCFFLLHEVPDGKKRAIVDALLRSVAPGGKVVFVDYHNPHRLQPIRYILQAVNFCLEPFARSLWRHAISVFASDPGAWSWDKRTFFGGVYQKVVARRRA